MVASLKRKMLVKLDYRFPITQEILVATLLDPRLQNLPKLLSELQKRGVSKFEFLKEECSKIVSAGHVPDVSNAQEVTTPKPSKNPKDKRSTMVKLIEKHAYGSTESESSSQESQRIDEEIHKYFLTVVPKNNIERFDILKFWSNHCKSLPHLTELVKKYLCIPVTSTSSERAFSYAGLIINAKRSSLGPNVVEKTLFIHDNYSLVKKTIFSSPNI